MMVTKLKAKRVGFYGIGGLLAFFLILLAGCGFQKEVSLNESLCIETKDGCDQIIKRGTKLPTSFTNTYSNMDEDQTVVQITLYQGEDTKIERNRLIGTFSFPITPSKNAGESRVQITVTIDEAKKLMLTAKDLATGRQEEIVGGIVN